MDTVSNQLGDSVSVANVRDPETLEEYQAEGEETNPNFPTVIMYPAGWDKKKLPMMNYTGLRNPLDIVMWVMAQLPQ